MLYLLAANPILNAYYGSDPFGKAIFLGLLLLSIITWTLFSQKFLLQRNVKKKGSLFIQAFHKKRLHPLTLEIGEGPPHPFATLYRNLKEHTLELLQKNRSVMEGGGAVTLSTSDIDLIQAHLLSTVSSESQQLEKNLFILSTIVSLAPFLGLLGTVWGILLTFGELQSGSGAGAQAAIMGGLAMALGTTVLGLLVAIPALISFNYLRANCSHLSGEMEDFSHLLIASVELQYRQVDIK